VSAIRALADGDLAAFHGLPAGLERAALDEALGEPGPEESGMLGGQPAVNRTYPPRDGAPFGVKAWLEGDAVAVLEIREPPLRAPVGEQLGEPEAKAPSGLGPSYEQRVYGSRGLVLHVSGVTGEVRRLYAVAPQPADQLLAGPLGRVEERRIPRR